MYMEGTLYVHAGYSICTWRVLYMYMQGTLYVHTGYSIMYMDLHQAGLLH